MGRQENAIHKMEESIWRKLANFSLQEKNLENAENWTISQKCANLSKRSI